MCHPEGAWTWIIPFSDGRTSVGVVALPELFERYSGSDEEQLRALLSDDPNVDGRLAGCEFVFAPMRVRGYSYSVRQLYGPHFALAGNAGEFIDPIFSSGVLLALASANRAAKVIGRHLRDEPVDWEEEYSAYVRRGTEAFRAYVAAWYSGELQDILFAAQSNEKIQKQICSVLAGYVWDEANPYATQAKRALQLLTKVVRQQTGATAEVATGIG